MSSIMFAIVFGVTRSYFLDAMILTKYKIESPNSALDLVSCGESAMEFDYCAARVTGATCEPLMRNWCETKDMSVGGSYLVKQTIVEVLEETLVNGYDRLVPMYVSDGSEFEFKFMLHSGWDAYGIDFKNNLGDTVLHTKLRYPDDFFFNARINGTWYTAEGHMNIFSFTVDAEYTLRIVCKSVAFEIYLNDNLEWTYSYQLSANTIKSIDSYFSGVQGDLYKVTYRATP